MLLSAAALISVPFAQNPHDRDDYVSGRVLVKFAGHVPPGRVLKIVSDSQSQLEDQIEQVEVLQLKVPNGWTEEQLLKHLKQFPEVEFAELDYWRPPTQSYAPSRTPSDPNYSIQWHLPLISLPIAWNTTTGSSALKIAIIDTGVDGSHPDLAGKLVSGWNFFDGNSDTTDVYGHGTAVAGTAAASGDNGIGVTSPA